MKIGWLVVMLALLPGCSGLSRDDVRDIAYERLSEYEDGPSLHGEALRAGLVVTEQRDGKFLVEWRDEPRRLDWAVIVMSSGDSEITRMPFDD